MHVFIPKSASATERKNAHTSSSGGGYILDKHKSEKKYSGMITVDIIGYLLNFLIA